MQQSRSFFVSGDVSLPQEHYHIMSISVCSGQCIIFLCFSYLTYSGVTQTCSGNIHVSVPLRCLSAFIYHFHGNIIGSQLYLIDLIFLSFSPFCTIWVCVTKLQHFFSVLWFLSTRCIYVSLSNCMCQSTKYVYMGAKFSSIFRIP